MLPVQLAAGNLRHVSWPPELGLQPPGSARRAVRTRLDSVGASAIEVHDTSLEAPCPTLDLEALGFWVNRLGSNRPATRTS